MRYRSPIKAHSSRLVSRVTRNNTWLQLHVYTDIALSPIPKCRSLAVQNLATRSKSSGPPIQRTAANQIFPRHVVLASNPTRPRKSVKLHRRFDGADPFTGKRWLHSQELRASQMPQMRHEDVVDHNEEQNVACDIIPESDLDNDQGNEINEGEEKISAGSIKEKLKNISRVTDQLLRLVGKLLPNAQPLIQIQRHDQQEYGALVEKSSETVCIRFSNEEYDIVCEHNCVVTSLSQASLRTIFEGLSQDYIDKLLLNSTASKRLEQRIESYIVQKLLDLLDLQPVSIDRSYVDFDNARTNGVRIHRAQAYSGHEPLGKPQFWPDPVLAERLARYSVYADLMLRIEQSGLDLTPLQQKQRPKSGNTKKKRSLELERIDYKGQPWVYDVSISQKCLSAMIYALQELRNQGLPDTVELQPLQAESEPRRRAFVDQYEMRAVSRKLRDELLANKISPELEDLRKQRDKLPIRRSKIAAQIHHMIKKNDIFVLVAETGSGKTTQLPQILLEKTIMDGKGAWCNVICTQPRRIAATSVAARVARERGTHLGGSVGYQIRFDHRIPYHLGSINYSTAGVLLKKLQVDSEAVLSQTTHIVVDEVHERDLNVDLLLAFLRDLTRIRRVEGKICPKIILMSATMKALEFEQYFAQPYGELIPKVASMSVQGRAHSVTTHMLDDIIPMMLEKYARNMSIISLLRESREYLEWEDEFIAEQAVLERSRSEILLANCGVNKTPSDKSFQRDPLRDEVIPNSLITALVSHILREDEDGDILIFVPGMKEMDALAITLVARQPLGLDFDNRDKIRIFKLHSAFHDTNYEVFKPVPPGCRRVILATNIAQTSITLPEVVHVIDSGKRREMIYDQVTRQNEFGPRWIDRATSFQRSGRAGRTKPGHYWAMFSKARFESLPEKAKPEILISDLTSSSLILKSYSSDINLRDFFARTLDPPDSSTAEACIRELKDMQMLTADERITPLGKFCSDFPLHPAKARGLLMGMLFYCFQPLLIVACHDLNSPLIHSPTNRKEMYHAALSFASVSDDDRYVFVKAFSELEDAHTRQAVDDIKALEQKSIRREVYQTMSSIGHQLSDILAEYSFLPYIPDANAGQRLPSVFQNIPSFLDKNSHRLNLFKALALTVNNANIAVWHEKEQAWLANDIKCMLRPYSVNTMQSLRLLERAPLRKTGEVVYFSEMVRNVQSSTRPFLVESSSISPLMAMLFGRQIRMFDNDTIEINGWLRYKIKLAIDPSGQEEQETVPVAAIVLEFRRAIDRFLTMAFSDVRNVDRSRMSKELKKKYNNFFWPADLRNTMIEVLLAVLDIDAEHWDNVTQQTPSQTNSKAD